MGIHFRGTGLLIHENREHLYPRNILAIRYCEAGFRKANCRIPAVDEWPEIVLLFESHQDNAVSVCRPSRRYLEVAHQAHTLP